MKNTKVKSHERNSSLTNQSIDRKPKKEMNYVKKAVVEKVPDIVADMLVKEFLSNVGGMDWNEPCNVSRLISTIMSIDTSKPLEEWEKQQPIPFEIPCTIMVPSSRDLDKEIQLPAWILQSFSIVDEKHGNRYINYKGGKYNKIDIALKNTYFKKRMSQVAELAHCDWNVRWGNSKIEKHKLYQKTRANELSWLEKCIKPLLNPDIQEGVNIKDILMVEFKRKGENEPE